MIFFFGAQEVKKEESMLDGATLLKYSEEDIKEELKPVGFGRNIVALLKEIKEAAENHTV